MSIEKAELSDGRILEYVLVPDPPAGGMKETFFAPDRSYVVQFYKDLQLEKDPNRLRRLDKVIGPYNPTKDATYGEYWRKLFCWPTGIVVKPRLGIVCPTYRPNFFFNEGPFKGQEKEGNWFVLERPRRMLTDKDRGTWINYFAICILIARAVRRLHAAGLAHSDLSPKNILVDPSVGESAVIDIDSLVVPGIFPPDVVGTPGYIAPEVLQTLNLPINDPNRKHPSTATDLHALAVLIYQYLLLRHPLRGPKVHSTVSTEEDDKLAMGAEALFIENPNDKSNRPKELKIPYEVLGPLLSIEVRRAFVDGLHNPSKRPAATEWERALCRTWDLKVDCQNPKCPSKWFIFQATNPVCPFCGVRRTDTVPILKLRKQVQGRPGQWRVIREVVVHRDMQIFEWHVLDNKSPDESANRTRLAYCSFYQGQWLLINEGLTTLTSPTGNRVPLGQAVALTHGAVFRFSTDPHGYLAEVDLVNCSSAAP
jgi:hypothetical protein